MGERIAYGIHGASATAPISAALSSRVSSANGLTPHAASSRLRRGRDGCTLGARLEGQRGELRNTIELLTLYAAASRPPVIDLELLVAAAPVEGGATLWLPAGNDLRRVLLGVPLLRWCESMRNSVSDWPSRAGPWVRQCPENREHPAGRVFHALRARRVNRRKGSVTVRHRCLGGIGSVSFTRANRRPVPQPPSARSGSVHSPPTRRGLRVGCGNRGGFPSSP